ncbi:hypothetical protein ACTXP0_03955 [Psychrobacter celer]|uniref:hypothetical protein n=1 Tax=Psychrobacter celer TaxID=306572 RepID=UPI003FD0D3BC
MYKAKRSLNIANAFSFNKYQSQILSLIGFMILSFASISSHALAPNPGAVCDSNFAQGSLNNADYTNLVSAVNTNNYVNIAGNASGSIPLKIKMSTVESSTSTVKSNFGVITSDNKNAINVRRTFPTPSDYTDTKLEFLNSITEQPIYLTNVAISAFDIDYAYSFWGGSNFNDYVQITGVTEAGNTIEANLQPITGSNIDYSQGLYTANTFVNCPAKNLGTACQGSVQFSQPVASINIRYTNRGRLIRNPTNQEIDFRIDNYCYAPQYIFSGTVFNDNGGLSGSPKNDLTNSFINTYKYFNGVFDNGESGIDGSALNNLKVRLTDCNSTDITGTTPQNVSDTGSYSFTVPASAVAGKSQVCLIQEEPDPWSYSVDTTPNRLEVPINNSVYLYEDNNFGEVIAEQTALVLKKYQYVHQCDANLNYNNILDKDSPLNGFSINAPRQDEKVDPGQCIAYKIEAYNHGHITLTDIRITDILQKTPVESVFHLPNSSGIAASLRTTDNPTSGLVNIGDNGVIITEPFKLTNTAMTTTVSKRTLYFNTKYGN